MYLERVKSKGNCYLYLKNYSVRQNYASNKVTVYRFGRIEQALESMYRWKRNFKEFPKDLIDIGCNKKDLEIWIQTLETGVHKSGKKFGLGQKEKEQRKAI